MVCCLIRCWNILKKMDFTKHKDILEKLKMTLTPERYEHSIGVAEEAVRLAEIYGADIEKACIAGLLHDCAKCLPKEKLLDIIVKNKDIWAIDECELLNYKTFHAPAGVLVAQKEYGINDKEILSAIRWHTLGKKDMTLLEKIIYLADKIEKRTRPAEYREQIEVFLKGENGLDRAILESYKLTIKSLADRNLVICYPTIDIYNSLLKEFY